MSSPSTSAVGSLADVYRRNRQRSRALFDLLADDAYYSRPIDLRHPIVFYEGHLPAFSFNTLVKRALGRPSIDPDLETLFARGIDPPSPQNGFGGRWPTRAVVQAFADEADRQVLHALRCEDLERPGHPLLERAEAAFAPVIDGPAPSTDWIDVSGGGVTLGVDREGIEFGWDNECPRHAMPVGAFRMRQIDVTNEQFLEFVDAGGYTEPRWWRPDDWMWLQQDGIDHPRFWAHRDGAWWWRGMFEWVRLPVSWPVYVSHAEASAFARWAGARLPTEAEFQRAAFGVPAGGERAHPWGDAPPNGSHGVFDLRAGTRSRSDLTRRAEASGGSTISSATDGNGHARHSHRSPASGRCLPIRSTPPTSSTGSTT